jgi:hypothetical protein
MVNLRKFNAPSRYKSTLILVSVKEKNVIIALLTGRQGKGMKQEPVYFRTRKTSFHDFRPWWGGGGEGWPNHLPFYMYLVSKKAILRDDAI